MKCSRIKKLFSSYIDGMLPENKAKEIDEHIKTCKHCRRELEIMQQSVKLCRKTETAPLPMYFDENLLDRIDLAAERRWTFRVNRPWIYSSTAAAVICIVFMWNFLYSAYMENKAEYNPPLTQGISDSERQDSSSDTSWLISDTNQEESPVPEEITESPQAEESIGEQSSPSLPDASDNSAQSATTANAASSYGSTAKPTAAPTSDTNVKQNQSPSAKSAKIASDSVEDAAAPIAERSVGNNAKSSAATGGGGSYSLQAAPANAAPSSKSTFVAAADANEAISWINSNLHPLGSSSSKGYTIITLSESDFYKLKAAASEFGASTADISENAPYSSIIDHSGGYSAVIYNP